MNLYNIIGYPLFFVSALELILGVILLRHNPKKSPINKAVAAFSFFSSAFSFFTALMYTRASLGLDFLLAAKATWVAWLTIPAALQFVYYLRDEKSRKARLAGLILYPFWSVILLIALLTNWIVAGPYTLIPYVYNPGPLDSPARIIAGSLILWLIVEIYLSRRKESGAKRAKLNYFFIGTLIFAGAGSILGAFLQLFGIAFDPTLCSYTSFVWLLLTFYAITRHQLFDIPLMIARTISIALLIGIFSAVHVIFIAVLDPVLGATLADLTSFVVMALLLLGTPLIGMVQERVNSILLKRRYNYQQILKDSSQAVITILDLDVLLDYLGSSIRESLQAEVVHLFLRAEDDDCFRSTVDGSHAYRFDADTSAALREMPDVLTRSELEDMPPGHGLGKLHALMAVVGYELMIPLRYKGHVQGILTLGPRKDRSAYIQSDIDLLKALAGHASVAIENARLYEKAKRVEESLQESEQKFRALAETINAGITINSKDRFLYINPAAEALTGFAHDEFLALDFNAFVHPDFLDLVRERSQARFQQINVPSQYESKIVRKDGEVRWVLVSTARIQYGGEPATIAALVDITEYKRIEKDRTLYYEESLRQYREKIEDEQRHQAEIKKILMDIHDGIGGITTNISMLSEIARKATSPEVVARALSTISELSRGGIDEIRSLMRSLDSKDLTWASLVAELRALGMSMVVPHAISFEMTPEINSGAAAPGSILCLNLFRIYREALTNIIKHAEATKVSVDVRVDNRSLVLTICDNGRGRADAVLASKGRGLANMKARAAEIGGDFTITTDNGMCVRIEILHTRMVRTAHGAAPAEVQ